MTLPRWLVVSLLIVSLLAVFGAGAWWWVTWPERTARAFIESPPGVSERILSPPLAELSSTTEFQQIKIRLRDILPIRRTFGYYLKGRQLFVPRDYGQPGVDHIPYCEVRCGRVVDIGVMGDRTYSLLDPPH
jgi:hypothetical protein